MYQVTKEDVERRDHLPCCYGWEDCECFGRYVSYKELWDLQRGHTTSSQSGHNRTNEFLLALADLLDRYDVTLYADDAAEPYATPEYVIQVGGTQEGGVEWLDLSEAETGDSLRQLVTLRQREETE